jgi:hypothetical protein
VSSPLRTAVSPSSSRRLTSTTSPPALPRPPPSVPPRARASTSQPPLDGRSVKDHRWAGRVRTNEYRIYSAIVNSTAKRNYRPDLRKDAVARASAIRKAGKPVKASPAQKLRGAKAQKAAEASA